MPPALAELLRPRPREDDSTVRRFLHHPFMPSAYTSVLPNPSPSSSYPVNPMQGPSRRPLHQGAPAYLPSWEPGQPVPIWKPLRPKQTQSPSWYTVPPQMEMKMGGEMRREQIQQAFVDFMKKNPGVVTNSPSSEPSLRAMVDSKGRIVKMDSVLPDEVVYGDGSPSSSASSSQTPHTGRWRHKSQ